MSICSCVGMPYGIRQLNALSAYRSSCSWLMPDQYMPSGKNGRVDRRRLCSSMSTVRVAFSKPRNAEGLGREGFAGAFLDQGHLDAIGAFVELPSAQGDVEGRRADGIHLFAQHRLVRALGICGIAQGHVIEFQAVIPQIQFDENNHVPGTVPGDFIAVIGRFQDG